MRFLDAHVGLFFFSGAKHLKFVQNGNKNKEDEQFSEWENKDKRHAVDLGFPPMLLDSIVSVER